MPLPLPPSSMMSAATAPAMPPDASQGFGNGGSSGQMLPPQAGQQQGQQPGQTSPVAQCLMGADMISQAIQVWTQHFPGGEDKLQQAIQLVQASLSEKLNALGQAPQPTPQTPA